MRQKGELPMRLKFAVALAFALFPALALAHPTDASMHAHRSLSDHSGKMHSHMPVVHRG